MTETLFVFSDFDATISTVDVTDALLGAFGNPAWRVVEDQWKSGRIGSRECMRRQVAMLDCDQPELDGFLAGLGLDPHFADFAAYCIGQGFPLAVLSDGLDYAIRSLLRGFSLEGLPVFANRLVRTGERELRLEFPHADPRCPHAAGTCKCRLMADLAQGGRTVYIGDGTSDFCAAGKADLVFAKDRLLDHCREQGLPHLPFEDFSDVLFHLQLGAAAELLGQEAGSGLLRPMELAANV